MLIAITLLPRYLYRAWSQGYNPGDLEVLRYIRKMHPDLDVATACRLERQDRLSRSSSRWRSPSRTSRPVSFTSAIVGTQTDHSMDRMSLDNGRILDIRLSSRTDMSTGVCSRHRGFDFVTEEGGVAIRRMQTNLSERWQSSRDLTSSAETKHSMKRKASMRIFQSLRRKKPPTPRKDN